MWWCELSQISRRPVVVLSRDAAVPRLRRAVVAPCTTTIRGLSSEVVLEPGDDPIPLPSAVNLDSVESVTVGSLTERMGRLSDGRMREICAALTVAVDCRMQARAVGGIHGARSRAERGQLHAGGSPRRPETS